MDKISVIVPVYNAEKYLEKCLNSLIHQTYSNIEIIGINDGSTDNSLLILNNFAEMDSRIKVISQKNGSSARARDTGLSAATGDWITFADNDDWLEPDMYEKMIFFGKKNPADILACGYFFNYPDKEIAAENRLPVPSGVQNCESFLYYIYCRDEYKGVSSYIWNKLFKATIIQGIGFDYSLGNLGDDIDWASRCYMQAKTIAYLPESLYHHRERQDSVFHGLDRRLESMQHILAYEKMIALYEERKVDQRALDYVKRFYVYHLGVLMERALETGNKEKMAVLRKKALPYLDTYYQTNMQYPERIRWAEAIFGESI